MGSFRFSAACLLCAAVRAGAQASQLPLQADTAVQRVEGQVVKPGKNTLDPITGVWVTLHRVGHDRQGPLDSIRTDSRGKYSFRYRRTGNADALYFVSVSHDGIAYFSSPFQTSHTFGPDAEITVFDTTSRHVPISVRGHHLVVAAVDANGMREVEEIFELSNDSSVTRIAAGTSPEDAVWSAPMLPGALTPVVHEGDFPAAGVGFSNNRISLFAPLAPGLKQLFVSYALPAAAFPVGLPILQPTQVLEVMLEEERGTVTGASLKEVAPVNRDQRNFRRFLASDVPSNSVATVDLPKPAARSYALDSRYLIAVTLALAGVMAAVLANALRRK